MQVKYAVLLGLTLFIGPSVAVEPTDLARRDEETLKAAGIPTTTDGLLAYFRHRTLQDTDRAKLELLIRQLGDDSFPIRQKAAARVVMLGAVAEPFLRQALENPDVEIVRRAEECLRQIKSGVSAAVPVAAVHLLARQKPESASGVLLAFLPFADNETVAQEVRSALGSLAIRNDKADPVILKALEDPLPARRAAAGTALYMGGTSKSRGEARRLLKDSDPGVRLQIALAMAEGGEADAIPALIDLLAVLPQDQGWRAEDLLLRLAEEKAPEVTLGLSVQSRRQCSEAWTKWWHQNKAKIDLTPLARGERLLGYTVILLLDSGKVLELDHDGKKRWEISDLQFPLDVQLLPGNRVLVAEHGANSVTERDQKGTIVWTKKVDGPLVAQRLPNGNTFIATNTRLLEVNRAGKEVFSYVPQGGELVMKAQKLRDGDIACVLSTLRFVRLDTSGHEIRSFPVDVHTSGGRIDVLPNGNVLVPEYQNNKVVEYSPEGKALWEVSIEQPIAAVHLPNGHVLATSMSQHRAVEWDRTGKEIWEYKSDTRVTRALRR